MNSMLNMIEMTHEDESNDEEKRKNIVQWVLEI